MRRVELTHDVLCSVVALQPRPAPRARGARRGRAAARARSRRARPTRTARCCARATIAAVCAVLMLVAGASAVFGWVNLHRAGPRMPTRRSTLLAEQARGDAEKLVGFLIEDFYAELEPTGRLETMGKLAHMAVSYYDGLPPELITPQTQVYRGMALVREGGALLARGDVEGANPQTGRGPRAVREAPRGRRPGRGRHARVWRSPSSPDFRLGGVQSVRPAATTADLPAGGRPAATAGARARATSRGRPGSSMRTC